MISPSDSGSQTIWNKTIKSIQLIFNYVSRKDRQFKIVLSIDGSFSGPLIIARIYQRFCPKPSCFVSYDDNDDNNDHLALCIARHVINIQQCCFRNVNWPKKELSPLDAFGDLPTFKNMQRSWGVSCCSHFHWISRQRFNRDFNYQSNGSHK